MLTEAFDSAASRARHRDAARRARVARETFNIGIIVERLGGSRPATKSSSTGWTDGVELTAPAHEQNAALYHGRSGYVERDGVKPTTRFTASGRPTVFLLPTWSSSLAMKMQIPPRAPCRASSRSTAAGTAAPTGPWARGVRIREFALDALAVLDATATEARSWSALVRIALGRLARCEHPERVAAAAFISRRSRWRRRCPSARCTPSTSRSTPTKGGRVKHPPLAARLPRLPRVLFGEVLHGAPHSTSRSRTASRGPLRRRPNARRPRRGDRPADRSRVHRSLRACRLPVTRHAWRRGCDPAARAGRGARPMRRAGSSSRSMGAGHLPQARDPVKVESAAPGLHRPPPAARRWCAASRAASARSTSPRRSGSACQRDAAIADDCEAPSRPRDRLAAQHP